MDCLCTKVMYLNLSSPSLWPLCLPLCWLGWWAVSWGLGLLWWVCVVGFEHSCTLILELISFRNVRMRPSLLVEQEFWPVFCLEGERRFLCWGGTLGFLDQYLWYCSPLFWSGLTNGVGHLGKGLLCGDPWDVGPFAAPFCLGNSWHQNRMAWGGVTSTYVRLYCL